MRLFFFRTSRMRKMVIIPKRYLAVPAALACILARCLLVNLPASVTAAERKAEEEKAEMLAAIEKSGLSYSEVLELLK